MLTCRRPPPRRSEPNRRPVVVRLVPAFPQSRQGRPSHRAFRGRLGVHACYGLSTCRRPDAALCLLAFDHIVTAIVARIATRPGRPLPGQDLHLLEQRTFHGARGPPHQESAGTTTLDCHESHDVSIDFGEFAIATFSAAARTWEVSTVPFASPHEMAGNRPSAPR